MLPLSFKIELNTLNKTKESQTRRSESKVFLGETSVVSFLSSCVFFSFTFLFSFSMIFLLGGRPLGRSLEKCKI